MAAIGELGYRPNQAARALATRRTNTVGILAPAVSDFGPTSTVHALETALRAVGHAPLVTSTLGTADAIDAAFAMLLDQTVRGIIVVGPSDTTIDTLGGPQPVPVVTLESKPLDATAVSIDQTFGVNLVVRHLIELGHVAIQHLAGPPGHLEARERATAFADAIRIAGLPCLPQLNGDWSARSGFAAASHLDPRATALFSANDQMALGASAALSRDHVAVPHDLSVVGFDDIPEAAYVNPSLTTVRQDFVALAVAAVAQLFQLLNGEAVPLERIRPELMRRASTATPRSIGNPH